MFSEHFKLDKCYDIQIFVFVPCVALEGNGRQYPGMT